MKEFSIALTDGLCLGCMACRMACKEAHGLGRGEGLRQVWAEESESGTAFRHSSCRHCAHPPCAAACPVGAIYKAGDGAVCFREELCIGCGACAAACPYGHPFLRRSTGRIQKCDGCAQRRSEGLEPICVSACPTRALKVISKGEDGL